jgi:hypothetical protein
MCLNVEKNLYKVYTKIQFRCSNTDTDSPLSSNRVKLLKQQLRNLRVPQHCLFFSLVGRFEDFNLPASEPSWNTSMLGYLQYLLVRTRWLKKSVKSTAVDL